MHDPAAVAHRPLPDFRRGIDGLRLEPGESLICQVAFQTPDRDHHCTVRAIAYAQEARGERLVGGQTFVYGHVKRLNPHPHHHHHHDR